MHGRFPMARLSLYPPIEPYDSGLLAVSPLHRVYYEQVGNPGAIPAVFLHGGPGAGLVPVYRQIFDPAHFRVVLLDQRGAGRSQPAGELRENTTSDLVRDLEALREHLEIERWLVVGGSWGGTLALAYAQTHPERVSGLLLRGTWLVRPRDYRWMFGPEGAALIYPDDYRRFVEFIPEDERGDIVAAYYRRVTGEDGELARAAAQHWGDWEAAKISLHPEADLAGVDLAEVTGDYLKLARFEISYSYHRCWLPGENTLLDNMSAIADIPGTVICGRYDTITPLESSHALVERWPAAELVVVEATGHAFFEEGIVDAHVRATRAFAERLSQP